MYRYDDTDDALTRVLDALRCARFTTGVHCPRCGCERVHRWGQFAGRQRFRCTGCERTFSDLTGSPAAYIKKLSLWHRHAECMASATSVRRTAARLRINPTTAFRWRHRLLDHLRTRPSEPLADWIELDETRFPYSEKGQRAGYAPARRRGLVGWERLQHHQTAVVIASDRRGHLIHVKCVGRRPTLAEMERGVGDWIVGRPTICAEQGRFGIARRLAQGRQGAYRDARRRAARPSHGSGTLVHIRTARAARHRLHAWMARFRGVATKYLANYLVWHCHVDRPLRQGMAAEVLRWPLDLESKTGGPDAERAIAGQSG